MKLFKYFLFLTLIVLILGEVLTRIFIPIDPFYHNLDRSEDHPYIRTDWVPGFQRKYVIEGIAGQTGVMDFKINEFGFRSSSMKTAQKPAGTYRIFFLGGSTTESLSLPEEKTFPSLVERKLSEAYPDKKFESINGGISGYLASDVLALLIYKVQYFEPDTVVVMLAVNDLLYGTLPTYDPIRRLNYRKLIYGPDFREDLNRLLARLFKRSHFLTLIKWRIVNRLLPPDAEKYQSPFEQYHAFRQERLTTPFTSMDKSKSLDEFATRLREIKAIAHVHGIRLIFMTEPFVYQENLPQEINEKLWMGWLGAVSSVKINLRPDFLYQEMNRFNEAVRQLSRDEGVELIDLEKQIPKDLVHFYDDVHLTPEGARKAGEIIASYFFEHPSVSS